MHLFNRFPPKLIRRSLLSGVMLLLNQATVAAGSPAATLKESLQPYLADKFFAGAVIMVATPERMLCEGAVGWMDITQKIPMRTDAVFWIASQTKPMTAAAVMVLVDEGKLSVDDPVEKYLPEFKSLWVKGPADDKQMVLTRPHRLMLVRDLLSHTSGLPPYAAIEEPAIYDLFPLRTRTLSYASAPLDSEPGAKYAYANAGFNTLGRIIEVVSGRSYEQFMDERIFRPLGMTDTTFWPAGTQLVRLAKTYKTEAAGLTESPIHIFRYPLENRERQAYPGGGLFSTARDLSIFYRMLANDGTFEGRRILSAASVRQMTMDQTGPANNAYGFGLHITKHTFGHAGAYGSSTVYDRDTGLIMIFLVQQVRWEKGGEKTLPAFQKAAAAAFGPPPTK